ncbi:tyrosine-protein kinase family protein [Actinomycetospora termitidis]|uniref:Capsular polysaccharide biosynthesis protein n=1 Tax=Actinomycetospora termitidis TaxID=3053470 RepID=A0ABT7MEB4_9PSEU|nr:hypothetical protein [Actinomycetospora sp. Odt1-22]MDL5159000.1 hypothetical protein [Actinomycetospora sp. Odt1-22]
MNHLAVHLERVRRRWVLVAAIAVVAALAALVGVLVRPEGFTGRAALAIVSQNRSPDQDAVLGRGYVDLFNQPSQQQVLAQRLGLGPDVTFSARLAAGSPIIYVEAVAPDPELAASAATRLASTYRDDVRNNLTPDRVAAAAELTTQLQAAQGRLASLSPTSPDRRAATDQINSLQAQLTTVQSNTTNQLKDLQLDAGVTENATGSTRTLVLALLGGVVGGVALALALGLVETRLSTPLEARSRLGREVLAVVRDGADPAGHRSLADVLALPDLPVPGALAVAPADEGSGLAALVASSLARMRSRQRGGVLLIQADRGARAPIGAPGVAEVLERDEAVDLADTVVAAEGVWTVPHGNPRDDLEVVCSREGAAELLRRARTLADLVVAEVPSPATSAAGTVLCAAADRVLLVVEQGVTRAADARLAIARAERAGAQILGVVLVVRPPGTPAAADRDGGHLAPEPMATRSAVPVPRPAAVPHRIEG